MARCRNRNRWWWWWHENVQRNRCTFLYACILCFLILSYVHYFVFSYCILQQQQQSTLLVLLLLVSSFLLPFLLPFLSSSSHKETSPSVQRTTLLIRKPKHQVDSLHNGIGLWVVGVYEQTTANERGSGRKCKTNSVRGGG